MAMSWAYPNPGNPVNFYTGSRSTEPSCRYSRGAGDPHVYAATSYQPSIRASGTVSQYPGQYWQPSSTSAYAVAQEDRQSTGGYVDASSDYPMRPQEPQAFWHPINNQTGEEPMPNTTLVEESPSGSFSGLSSMAGTLPAPTPGSRILPQPGQKLERSSLPKLSNASSSLASDGSVPFTNFRGRPSWHSSVSGSTASHSLTPSAGLSNHDVHELSSDSSSVSPTTVSQRARYDEGNASNIPYDEAADQPRATEPTYGSGFGGESFLGSRDPYANGLYDYGGSSSSRGGSASDVQSTSSRLISNGETYSSLPVPLPPPSSTTNANGGQHTSRTQLTPILPNVISHRYGN